MASSRTRAYDGAKTASEQAAPRPAPAPKGPHRLDRFANIAATALLLLLPWMLIHFLAGAEVAAAVIPALFLLTSARTRGWAWLRRPWIIAALTWWAWLVLCTIVNIHEPGGGILSILMAMAMLRLVLLVAAIESWVLATLQRQTWFQLSLSAAALYTAAQTLLQFFSGQNLFGVPRYADGSLSGPFVKPRAGPTFVRMLFPTILPPVGALLARPGRGPTLAGTVLLLLGIAVVVLIGQRAPLALALLGLAIAALLLPRLRIPALTAVVAGGLLVAASAVISPPTFERLVTKFSQQMEGFADSHYGLIAGRAIAIVAQNPVFGRGYDAFRNACPEPRYFQPLPWPGRTPAPEADGGGAAMCTTHAHNVWLQVTTDAGLPGLALFGLMVTLWLVPLARGVTRSPLRVGLLVAVLIQLWPLSSGAAFQSVPIGLWLFLLTGYGLAVSRSQPGP